MSGPLSAPEKQRVVERWNEHTSDSPDLSAEVYWLAIPEVMRRHQRKLSGGPSENWVDSVRQEFFAGSTPVPRILSLGCGDGSLERDLARLKFFETCDAYDLSPVAIEKARVLAAESGFDGIRYATTDINGVSLPAESYDAIWFNGSLHHIAALEHVLDQCSQALKPDGYLIVNEYVGPNRFDFTPRQKEALAAAWCLVPERFKRSCMPSIAGSVQPQPPYPDPAEVEAVDPSEAVRSADIAEQRFVAKERPAGRFFIFSLRGLPATFGPRIPNRFVF